MFFFTLPLIFQIIWISVSTAIPLKAGEHCFGACELGLGSVTFNDTNAHFPKFRRLCASELRIESFYLCVKLYCTAESSESGLNKWNETCQSRGNVTLPPVQVIAHYTDEDIERVRRIRKEDTNELLLSNEVVLPNERLFTLSFDTLDIAYYEKRIHMVYGWSMYYFWATVVLIGVCTRLTGLINGIQQTVWLPPDSEYWSPEERLFKRRTGLSDFVKTVLNRYVIVPATFGYRCSQNIGWCTLPPRIQSLTIAAFIIINIVLCSVNYYAFSENMYWPNVSMQLWRYVSDRTGVIAFANFPIIWLFGMRNNVLLWLTGWGFGTYNSFHRWIARVATVEAVIHSVGYTVQVLEHNDWQLYWKYWTKRYWWMGELATIFMVALCVCSVYGLRRSYYEIFLVLHILLSFIVLVTMWYHVEIFDGEYDVFFWPCLGIWAFDRFLRVIRILSFNPRFWKTNATATYDSDANIVRLAIPCSASLIKPQAGAYYYIYILNDFYMWENHPFTMAYTRSESPDQANLVSSTLSKPITSRSASPESESLLLTPQSDCQDLVPSSMIFLIRPYSSFTHRLQSSCLLHPSSPRILVEGPYGSPPPLHAFTNIIFLVGGTGIAVPLSNFSSLLSSKLTANITIVWAVRELAFLDSVIATDLHILGALKSEKTELRVYVTKDADRVDIIEGDEWEGVHQVRRLDETGKRVTVRSGRPDIRTEVEDAVEGVEKGSLAVVACGPGEMADEARRAVVHILGRGENKVEYFEESFKW